MLKYNATQLVEFISTWICIFAAPDLF